jgi:hypothetical protein
MHWGSGADEIDQETANVTIDAISNSESDKGRLPRLRRTRSR